MIQIKRGSTAEWKNLDDRYKRNRFWNPDKSLLLADGQPGYDKTNHILKIGDGEHTWGDLQPISSKFSIDDLICRESVAADRKRDGELIDDAVLITYGEDAPSSNMTGKVYLQEIDEKAELNNILRNVPYQETCTCSSEDGRTAEWHYQVFNSNDTVFARCWTTLTVTPKLDYTIVEDASGKTLYSSDPFYWYRRGSNGYIEKYPYPVPFSTMPTETAMVAPNGWKGYHAWLACLGAPESTSSAKGNICYKQTGSYQIIRSFDPEYESSYEQEQDQDDSFIINITVEGTIDMDEWTTNHENPWEDQNQQSSTNAKKVTCYLTK